MSVSFPVKNPEAFEFVANWLSGLPHARTLGIQFVHGERGRATMVLPYQEKLVGDRKTGVLHGGVITTLIDSASALSICSMMDDKYFGPTLDLRIDYLRAATPGIPVYCRAECYRLTSEVAFTRATVYQDDNQQPVAYSVGTFMLGAQV